MYGQVSTGQEQEFDYGIKNNSTQTVTTPTYLGTVGADGTYGKILLADLQGKKAFLSTGLIKNGLISANGDPTKFNVTAGIGIISNFDDPENPISTIINFPAFTGVTPTYLLTGTITYVAIEEIGTSGVGQLFMQATPFTPEQRRSLIVLGAAVHSNLTTINVINNISAPTNASTNQLHDFIEAVGALNLTGNKYTANGANLQLNKSAGLIFKLGSNFVNDWKNPHELAQTAGTSLTFRYRTQNGTEGSDRINLDPALYDLNNVLTAVPNNKFTIQTVTMFQSGVTRIQYGQNVYDDLATAKNAVFTRNFVLEPNSKENGIIRAYIIMKNTTTSLQNVADADILEAQKFGGVASGGVALTLSNIVSALGYTPENVSNKATDFTTINNILYPTTQAVNDRFINKTADTQAKIGSLTLGENLTHANDNWMAFGTSITSGGKYTGPMSKQLSLVLNNFGESGSTSETLEDKFVFIPTLNSGNTDEYRLISVEHGINDALSFITIPTFKANITNFILDAKAKGWANNKILVINSNYCSRADLDTELEPYAIASIEVAIEQGVQYVDIYNYTKNNGGGNLLIDGVHLSDEGGRVYARGVISLMYGGLEVSNGLNVINGIRGSNIYLSEDSEINGIGIGKGLGDIPTNTVFGEDALMSNTTGYDITAIGFEALKNNTTGRGILAIGYQALKNNTTGVFITANGYQALMSNTEGINNTANGFGVLSSNTVGGANTANGMLSMSGNVSGNENTANGMFSIFANINGNRNTSNGYASLSSNIDGNDNTAVGNYSLGSNTSGDDNTSLGNKAGFHFNASSPLTNPSNSIFIGSQTRALADNGVNEIVIGYNVTGQGSNSTSIGNPSTVTTKIYGDIVSPSLTGNPTAPTPTLGDNDTSVATTAFVHSTTNSNAVLLTGNQAKAGRLIFNHTAADNYIDLTNSGSNPFQAPLSTTVNGSGSGSFTYVSASGIGSLASLASSGTGFRADNFTTNSIGFLANESGTGVSYVANSSTLATGDLFQFRKDGVVTSKVNHMGEFTMSKLTMNGITTLAVFTVATLPTPTGTAYATVSDALAPTYMATVVGGGSVVTPVFYNGSTWVAH